MKITNVETILLAIPFETGGQPWIFGGKPWTHFDVLLIRIETDEGITGWGESFARNRDASLKATIDTHIGPKLVGRDPTRIVQIKHQLEQQLHNFGRIGPVEYGISGVDIALWDILGKAAGIPLYRLLGGKSRDEVELYASLMRYANTSAVAKATERAISEGYRYVKLHEIGLEEVKAARAAAGSEIAIMLDTNCPWSLENALEMDRQLAAYKLYWLEEPVWPPENYAALAAVRAVGNHRIAAGENAGSMFDFKQMFDAKAVDIAQPDLAKAGGLTEVLKIAAVAEGYGVTMVPHCAMFGPGLVATVHFNAAQINPPILERLYIDLGANPMGEPMQPRNGRLRVPDGPGLGCDPAANVIARYRVA